jgi:hypothetical protein
LERERIRKRNDMTAKRDPVFPQPTPVNHTPPFSGMAPPALFMNGAPPPPARSPKTKKEGDAVGVVLSEVAMRRVDWLWSGHIALGKMTLIDGNPGVGKSMMTIDIAARVTTAAVMPDGTTSCLKGPRGVVLLSAEDGAANTIHPRLAAVGGDASKVYLLTGVTAEDGQRMPNIGDLNAIRQAIEKVDAALIVIDPLFAYTGKNDAHRDAEMRGALAPLVSLCEEKNVALLVLRHLNKVVGATPAMYRGGGTIGIIGAARCAFVASKDPEEEKKCVLAPSKINLCAFPCALGYHLEGVDVGISAALGVVATSRVVWDGKVDVTADALVAPAEAQESASRLDEAVAFLREELRAGAVASSTVDTHAKQQGHSTKTLKRARKVLGVVAFRDGSGRDAPWMQRLPDGPREPLAEPPGAYAPGGAVRPLGPRSPGQAPLGQPLERMAGPLVQVEEYQRLAVSAPRQVAIARENGPLVGSTERVHGITGVGVSPCAAARPPTPPPTADALVRKFQQTFVNNVVRHMVRR